MHKFTYFLIIVMLFMQGSAPMSKYTSEVVLDASQVTSERDIEVAIDTATAYGTRPGIVTLDGSKGKFEYTGDDRSINIYYSNITIRSFNWATIGNCDDGVFFDDTTTNNIVIEGQHRDEQREPPRMPRQYLKQAFLRHALQPRLDQLTRPSAPL